MKYLQAFICLLVVVFVLIPLYLALAAVCGVLRGQAEYEAEVGVNMDLNQLMKSWRRSSSPSRRTHPGCASTGTHRFKSAALWLCQGFCDLLPDTLWTASRSCKTPMFG